MPKYITSPNILMKYSPSNVGNIPEELEIKVARILRLDTKYVENQDYPTLIEINTQVKLLDKLRVVGTNSTTGNITAHQIASRMIVEKFGKEYEKYSSGKIDVLFISAYGSYARHDPIDKEEDLDLNVFISEKPKKKEELQRLSKTCITIYQDALEQANGYRPKANKLHAANIYDLNDIAGFLNYSAVFQSLVQYYQGNIEPIQELKKTMPHKLDKKIASLMQGYNVHLNLYPRLDIPSLPYQIFSYPEELWDTNPRVSGALTWSIIDICELDPFFRLNLKNWMDFEIERVSSRIINKTGDSENLENLIKKHNPLDIPSESYMISKIKGLLKNTGFMDLFF